MVAAFRLARRVLLVAMMTRLGSLQEVRAGGTLGSNHISTGNGYVT
jgi:hypothetical protein